MFHAGQFTQGHPSSQSLRRVANVSKPCLQGLRKALAEACRREGTSLEMEGEIASWPMFNLLLSEQLFTMWLLDVESEREARQCEVECHVTAHFCMFPAALAICLATAIGMPFASCKQDCGSADSCRNHRRVVANSVVHTPLRCRQASSPRPFESENGCGRLLSRTGVVQHERLWQPVFYTYYSYCRCCRLLSHPFRDLSYCFLFC